MTANDLINSAFRLINVLASGENPSAAESADALNSLNDMVDSWNIERLMIFTITRSLFTLVSGQQAYTLGTGGDFNISRPVKIDNISIVSLNNPSQPIELPMQYMTTDQWQMVPVKNVQSALPTAVYDDGAFPLRNLNYWPIPNTAVQTVIYAWTALTSFADLTTNYTFPPGYSKALRFNLALNLAPEYGNAVVGPTLVQQASDSKEALKIVNTPTLDLLCDAAVVDPRAAIYNFYTDMPVKS